MKNNEDIALVFAGGGAKGAYQIGVWKALKKLKIAHKIKNVSGSSVGALNAFLFTKGNLQIATETWLNMTQQDLLYSTKKSRKQLLRDKISCAYGVCKCNSKSDCECKKMSAWVKIKLFLLTTILTPAFIPVFTALIPLANLICKECNFSLLSSVKAINLMKYGILNGGIFSQDKLSQIIDTLAMSERNNCYKSFVTVCKNPSFIDLLKSKKPEYIDVIAESDYKTKNILLASSAIPFIYPPVDIDGQKYCDGGFGDNIPIKPLYDSGIRRIIVVYCENNKLGKLRKQIRYENKEFPDCEIIRIIPNDSFKDDFYNTLAINQELTQERINTGYKDCINVFKKLKINK